MRMLSKILAGAGVAGAMVALVAGPALADPPSGVTPRNSDVVGVGSDTSQFLYDQLSHDFNNQHKSAATKLYSWDAFNPTTGQPGDSIVTKSGCSAIARPNGGNAGIAALELNATVSGGTGFCIDYARSARGRLSTDPGCATGGICFVALARDAITWAARSSAAGGTNAPATLKPAQLVKIYTCATTNWSQVGGASAPIHPFLPQSGSALRTQFLLELGGGVTPITPGSCVNSTVQQNEGLDAQLNDPDALVPYSVGKFIAQVYHSAPCDVAGCNYPSAPTCSPVSPENLYGCNSSGVLTLEQISGTKPVAPWPLPPPPTPPAINGTVHISATFTPLFLNTISTVVRFSSSTTDNIPAYLEPFFAAATASTPGWACTNSKAKTDIKNYGDLPLSSCGSTS